MLGIGPILIKELAFIYLSDRSDRTNGYSQVSEYTIKSIIYNRNAKCNVFCIKKCDAKCVHFWKQKHNGNCIVFCIKRF